MAQARCRSFVAMENWIRSWGIMLLLIFAPQRMVAQRINPGSTLSPRGLPAWASSHNTFAFGFYNSSGGTYSVGVFYLAPVTSTVIWAANRTLTVSADAVLELGQDGNLVLYRFSAKGIPLWESKTSGQGVVGANMSDTGNFILVDSNSQPLWQTFLSPTDTLVPFQQLFMGSNLTTVQADTSISTYSLELQTNGNLSLVWNNDYAYWGSGTGSAFTNSSFNVSSLVLTLDTVGKLQLLSNSTLLATWLSSDFGPSPTRRLTLDPDGNLRIYTWSDSWTIRWQALENQCDVYGWCGSYGFCTYNGTAPFCTCPLGFNLLDPSLPQKGCRTDEDLSTCPGTTQVVSLSNTALFSYESDNYLVLDNDEGCKAGCLKDPTCVAAFVANDGNGECSQKRSHFITGYQFPFLQATSYLKVCNAPSNAVSSSGSLRCNDHSKTKSSRIGLVIGTTCTFAATILLELCVWSLCCRRIKYQDLPSDFTALELASGAPVRFSYRELQVATKSFSIKVGEGLLGAVYKGILPNKTIVAVKRLEGIQQGEKEFRMQLAIICNTHHMNLVRLIGFCSEGIHRLLVYEHMANLSLDKQLFDDSILGELKLNWQTRFNIALATARAIAYLHEECRDCIVHCNIKPENILLDDHLQAKVSDFGLAKLLKESHGLRAKKNARGACGYLAPEWLTDMPITTKSDVYSFGMVLLEIISGRRIYDSSMHPEMCKFPAWAFRQYEMGNIVGLADERLHMELDFHQLERAVQVAFWCIQYEASHRPSMSKVVHILEGNIMLDSPPMPQEGSPSPFHEP